jgi:hypothetical protein
MTAHKRATTLFAALIGISIVFSACQKAPDAEMNAAREAVSKAKSDPNVPLYAQNQLTRAEDALSSMETAAQAKKYSDATNFATEATAAAERAQSDARSAMTRLKGEADTAITAAKSALQETNGIVAQAAAKTPVTADITQANKDLAAAKSTIDEADAANQAERYQEAVDKAGAARSSLTGINQRVSQASVSAKRKK